jgi:nitrogen fixation protein NifU and related proteins
VSDLRDLYQEVILDHNRRPRNWGAIEAPDRAADGYNPLCGDKLRLTLRMDGDRIADVKFEGSGCAISKASASLMTDLVKGKTMPQAEDLVDKLQTMVTAPVESPEEDAALGKLAVLSGVREFPARVKCATLAWHTLRAALEGEGRASTE